MAEIPKDFVQTGIVTRIMDGRAILKICSQNGKRIKEPLEREFNEDTLFDAGFRAGDLLRLTYSTDTRPEEVLVTLRITMIRRARLLTESDLRGLTNGIDLEAIKRVFPPQI